MDNETKKINNEAYFQVPKSLFKMRRNGEISLTAFDIYILMLDRYKLSKKYKWIDNEGNIYINYSYEELLEHLYIKKKNIISEGLKELESLNLIKRKKRYRNSTVFYLTSESNQKVTLIKNESNQNDVFLKMKVTFSGSESNQKVTSKSEKNTQKDIGNKEENEGEKAPNKNNISNNNYKSNNNIYNNNSNNIYTTTTGTFRNELRLLLGVRKVDIDRILKYSNNIEKIKDVIDYANKNNKGDGYIIAALKENYNLTGKKQPDTHREKRAELDSNIKSADPCNAGEKDYSMSIDEALKRSRGKK